MFFANPICFSIWRLKSIERRVAFFLIYDIRCVLVWMKKRKYDFSLLCFCACLYVKKNELSIQLYKRPCNTFSGAPLKIINRETIKKFLQKSWFMKVCLFRSSFIFSKLFHTRILYRRSDQSSQAPTFSEKLRVWTETSNNCFYILRAWTKII